MTAICPKCGRDCGTKLALGKHEAKGCIYPGAVINVSEFSLNNPKYTFYDRHEANGAKCPVCKEIWADFVKVDQHTFGCLKCGCLFIPREKLDEINEWKRQNPVAWRVQTKDRVCGQTQAPDATEGVPEDPTPEKDSIFTP